MGLLTLYARKESTSEESLTRIFPDLKKEKDVQLYDEKLRPYARFPFHFSSKPTRRNRYVRINCYWWRLVWIDERWVL